MDTKRETQPRMDANEHEMLARNARGKRTNPTANGHEYRGDNVHLRENAARRRIAAAKSLSRRDQKAGIKWS
jgi:hypothetical protein